MKNKKLQKALFITLGVSVVVLAVVITVFNLPKNRLTRALGKADRYARAESFELAGEKYAKAISIDNTCTSAYLGAVNAYRLSSLEDGTDRAAKLYENYLAYFKTVSDEAKKDIMTDAVKIFIQADGIYNTEDCLKRLCEAKEAVGSNKDLDRALIDAYIKRGDVLSGMSKYTDALSNYEAAAALMNEIKYENPSLDEGIKNVLVPTIEAYAAAGAYDTAEDTVYRYKDFYSDIDLVTVLNNILDEKEVCDTKVKLLSKVIDAMKPYFKDFEDVKWPDTGDPRPYNYDWTKMMEADGSEEAEFLACRFEDDSYTYSEAGFNENYTGFGAGIYTFGNTWEDGDGNKHIGYYFFAGDYKNGLRDGKGVSFARTGESSYTIFEGNWKDDVPEGDGSLHIHTTEVNHSVYGNWTKGYADGKMSEIIINFDFPNEVFAGTYEAKDGIPAEVPSETADYVLDYEDGAEGLIDVLPSLSSGYDLFVTSIWTRGTKIGAIGF